jgi:hypothetical protein
MALRWSHVCADTPFLVGSHASWDVSGGHEDRRDVVSIRVGVWAGGDGWRANTGNGVAVLGSITDMSPGRE